MQREYPMADNMTNPSRQAFTGRSIIVFRQTEERELERSQHMEAVLRNKAGARAVASSLDYGTNPLDLAEVASADAMTMPRLGIAVVPESTGLAGLATPDSDIEAIIPERWDYLCNDEMPGSISRALRSLEDSESFIDPAGVRKLSTLLRMLKQLTDALAESPVASARPDGDWSERYADTPEATWGLQATRVLTSKYSGRGVRVAVIDTGLDMAHHDFQGRQIVRALFAPPGTGIDPTHSHGTHCAGTACGPRTPTTGPRYGIAFDSELYALKVFNDESRPGARRGDVIAAMDYANRNNCRVLSLSLGSATNGAEDLEYSRVITRLRRAGSLTIAAAGNEGRMGYKVGAPASSADAVAVAAIDAALKRADFSNTGAIDIAAPGVGVLSSVIGGGTASYNGTSMAAPHVAGIAALWLQHDMTQTPDQLEMTLRRTAIRLTQSAAEVGVGLVQAPQ